MQKKIKQAALFLAAALLLETVFFSLLTLTGYERIYRAVQSACFAPLSPDRFADLDALTERNQFLILSCDGRLSREQILRELTIPYATHLLRQSVGLKYLVTDLGYAEAELLNLYLSTGTARYQELAFDALRESGTEIALLESLLTDFLLPLKGDDGTVPLRLIGIGVPSSYATARYITTLADDAGRTPVASLQSFFERVSENDETVLPEMEQSLSTYESAYRDIVRTEYPHFAMALHAYVAHTGDPEEDPGLTMAKLLMTCYETEPRGKYLCVTSCDTLADGLSDRLAVYPIARMAVMPVLPCDREEGIYMVRNRLFTFFEKHNAFLHRANRKEYEGYTAATGSYFFAIAPQKHPS